MTNHVHLIIGRNGKHRMEDILRDFKKFTSSKLIKMNGDNRQESRRDWMLKIFSAAGRQNSNNKNFHFWQQSNHPIELTDNYMMDQKLEYLSAGRRVSTIILLRQVLYFLPRNTYIVVL